MEYEYSFKVSRLDKYIEYLGESILNYFNMLGTNVVHIMCIVIPVLSLFIGGFLVGKKVKKKEAA